MFPKIFAALSSYWLAIACLLGLFWLTLVGTISQREGDLGLYASQVKYFESWLVLHQVAGPWSLGDREFALLVPFPGGQTLMLLLGINLICGGFIRFRYSWKRIGVTITHVGILMMLAAGFVKYRWGDEGALRLWEGETGDEYVSYHEWEIAISERLPEGKVKEHLIPGERFMRLGKQRTATFTSPELPFEVTVSRVLQNARAVAAGRFANPDNPVVDGVFLQELTASASNEVNMLGLYATFVGKTERTREEAILTGDAFVPYVLELGGKAFGVDLRKKRYRMPFAVRLDRFVHELHPRTMQDKSFESYVTQVMGGTERKVHIEMNSPLRHDGLVLFQSGWGPQDTEGSGGRYYSVFAVVRNPSDQWPLISCLVITLGLLVHFGMKLGRYVAREFERSDRSPEALA